MSGASTGRHDAGGRSHDESVDPGTRTAASAAVGTVLADSYLTLHYRLSLADTGAAVISTFGENPATLQLGIGQMAESLERCLVGLAEGEHARFELSEDQAFGPRHAGMLYRLALPLMAASGEPARELVPGDLVAVPAPGGARMTGVLKEIGASDALVDFNHPLAGQRLVFEVRILGVL